MTMTATPVQTVTAARYAGKWPMARASLFKPGHGIRLVENVEAHSSRECGLKALGEGDICPTFSR